MPQAQAGVTALVAVGRGPAPVLLEEALEAIGGRPEVLLGVHRAQQLVLGDTGVEDLHQPREGLPSADGGVEGVGTVGGGHAIIFAHTVHGWFGVRAERPVG